MRPIRLRFSGLRSYREPADIDFTDLELFAVIGDTGAGKSTIIEALCLALYGRKTWSGDSLRDVIADGADIMRVELTFEAQDHRWTALRVRRRNSSAGQDSLTSATNHVPDINGSREVTAKVVELLGLTFDQFTRAVVMPQGRFDELLRASNTQRNAILKSLLGLDDLTRAAKAATSMRDQVRPIHDRYSAQREMLPTDPGADLTAARADLTRLEGEGVRLQQAFDSIAGPRSTEAAATSASVALRAELDRLGEAPVGLIDELRDHHRIGVELLAQLDGAVAAADQARDEKASAEARLVGLLRGFADIEAMGAARARVTDLRRDLPDHIDEHRESQAALTVIEANPPADAVDPDLIAATEAAARALDAARSRLREVENRLAEAARARAHLAEQREAAAVTVKASKQATAEAGEATEALRESEASVADAEQAVVAVEELVEQARHSNQVAALLGGHGAGDPCPVCERDLPVDFEGPSRADLDNLSAQLGAARSRREAAGAERDGRAQVAARLSATVEARQEALVGAQRALQAAVDTVVALGIDPDASDETSALASIHAEAEAGGAAVRSAEAAHRQATDALSKAEAELTAARAGHAERLGAAAKALAQARQRLQRANDLVDSLPASWSEVVSDPRATDGSSPGLAPAALDGLLDALEQARRGAEGAREQVASAEATTQAAAQRQHEIKSDAALRVTQPSREAVVAINLHLDRVRVLTDLIGRADSASGQSSLTGGPPSLGSLPSDVTTTGLPEVIASAGAALADADRLVAAGHAAAASAQSAADSARTQVAEALASVDCASIDDLMGRRGRAQEATRQAEITLARATTAVSEVAAIDQALASVAPLRADLEVLCTALGNRQFVDHLLERREAELLAEASRRLKSLSGDRFAFVADFGVKNTAAGEVRSPDALSGGERFQASLALALALVEIASRGAGRLDAVFVDEGFGSLDQAALEAALSTLGRVAGGGKTVALISHLRAVAEYVDTAMHVTRDDVFGSRIRTLTEDQRDQLLSDDVRSGLTG